MRSGISLILACAVCAGGVPALAQPSSVVFSKHNLSVSGLGSVRASSEDQVCIFCHTPHNATPIRPLWNRQTPIDGYSIYSSRAFDALPGQPTGASKMCLSCHDGTIALGNVVSRTIPITMTGGVTTLPAGASNLGRALTDDHPISFRFDSGLVARDPKLKDPALLPPEVLLDANSELQCTACHDAHNNSLGKFLVMHNENSELCKACHQVGTTSVAGHANCNSCHQPHTAPSGPYLLRGATIGDTCLMCHNGTVVGAPNIATDIAKAYNHDTASPVDPPPPVWSHAACSDCHDPHTMSPGAGTAPAVHPNFGTNSGVTASGSDTASAAYEYEVCFKCHADNASILPFIARRIVQNNTRLEFSTGAVSYHPVEGPGKNSTVPSLKPGWSTGSTMYCSDCHGSETGHSYGGSGADGIHGSTYRVVLNARYDTSDFTSESAAAYALCYRCHDRTSILNDSSFKEHRMHIVDERAPCAACHDPHGIASSQGNSTNNSNLINFASLIVLPDQSTGRLEFRDTGSFRGTCYLRCHGKNHSPEIYP